MRLITNEELVVVAGGKFVNPQGLGDIPDTGNQRNENLGSYDASETHTPGSIVGENPVREEMPLPILEGPRLRTSVLAQTPESPAHNFVQITTKQQVFSPA
jgi:hypothetical protein